MPSNLTEWLAVGSMVVSLVSIVGLAYQLYQSRLALQTQSLMDLEARFYAPEMVALRRSAARGLIAHAPTNCDLEDVLDFLHDVITLMESGVINRALAHEFYKYWIARYWLAAEPYVRTVRASDDPKTYTRLEAAARRIMAENPGVDYSPRAMRLFLAKEARLEGDALQAALAEPAPAA